MIEIPRHLSMDHAVGLVENEPIAQFEIGSMKNFVYLILDWSTKTAAIVDPQKDITRPLKILEEYDFTLQSILLTHSHYDHMAGVGPLLKEFPNLSVHVGQADVHRMAEVIAHHPQLKINQDGESIQVGNLNLRCIHTPGHSAGEFSYFLAPTDQSRFPYLFTGDTIFIRDCGRTDFEDGSNEQMFASIQKVKLLPPETVFLVGHHYAKECGTTLKRELEYSPPFRCQSVEELSALP